MLPNKKILDDFFNDKKTNINSNFHCEDYLKNNPNYSKDRFEKTFKDKLILFADYKQKKHIMLIML